MTMETIRLYAHTKSMVWEMQIPSGMFGPEVIVWGNRVFKFDEEKVDQTRTAIGITTYRRFNEVTAHFIT